MSLLRSVSSRIYFPLLLIKSGVSKMKGEAALSFTVLLCCAIFASLALAQSAETALEAEWPRFIISELHSSKQNSTLHKLDSSTGTLNFIRPVHRLYRSLTANALTDTICHFYLETFGIACLQLKTRTVLLPDLPRSNIESLSTDHRTSLSPFGDHLIFEEFWKGGVWILSLTSRYSRLLIPSADERYAFLEVDWENGYIISLRHNFAAIEVWRLEGNSQARLQGAIEISWESVHGMTLDVGSTTVYIFSDVEVAKANYDFEIGGTDVNFTVVLERDLSAVNPLTVCFYKGGLFWSVSDENGTSVQPLYRLDVPSLAVESKDIQLTKGHDGIHSMVVYEDVTGAGNRTNPCAKCSHICIPRRGSGYECTCPFGQPMSNSTTCAGPLKVWAIAQDTARTFDPKKYLQTYDALDKFGGPMVSYSSKRISTSIPQPDGYCALEGSALKCFDFTETSVGTWFLKDKVVRVLALDQDQTIVWLNGTCVKHKSRAKDTRVLYCSYFIDPDNVVVDHVSWHLFYRSMLTNSIVHRDLIKNVLTVIGTSDVEHRQPMRLAVDVTAHVLYYLSDEHLFRMYYSGHVEGVSGITQMFNLGADNKDQQLKFQDGMLYWLELRPNERITDPPTNVIMRFDPRTETRETFVKAGAGFGVLAFGVAKPSCSAFVGQEGGGYVPSRCESVGVASVDEDEVSVEEVREADSSEEEEVLDSSTGQPRGEYRSSGSGGDMFFVGIGVAMAIFAAVVGGGYAVLRFRKRQRALQSSGRVNGGGPELEFSSLI